MEFRYFPGLGIPQVANRAILIGWAVLASVAVPGREDPGRTMQAEDLHLLCKRHATSKLQEV